MYLNFLYFKVICLIDNGLSEKVLATFHEQLRILQFNNQNLHIAKI